MIEIFVSVIFGVIIGYIAGIFKETASYRKEIYNKKFKVYSEIFQKAIEIYFTILGIQKSIVDEDDLSNLRAEFFNSIIENSLVMSSEAGSKAMKFHECSEKDKTKDEYNNAMKELGDIIRKELKVKEIHGLTTALLSPKEFLLTSVKERLSLLKKKKNK